MHPLTGAELEFYLEAVWGLGEGLVGGVITPHQVTVKVPECTILKSRDIQQSMKYVCATDSSCEAGSVAFTDCSEEEARTSPLSESRVAALAQAGMDIARYYHHPQDIEWCLDREGRVLVVQARPVTSFSMAPETGLWCLVQANPTCYLDESLCVEGFARFLCGIEERVGQPPMVPEELVHFFFGRAYCSYEAIQKEWAMAKQVQLVKFNSQFSQPIARVNYGCSHRRLLCLFPLIITLAE